MQANALKNILLVDDDLDHLSLCSLILRRQHYAVRILPGCKDISDLLQVVRDFRPGLIFMDHNMPGVGGLDATRMLKADPLYKGIPIIYFSGQDDIVQLATAAGADDCLRKNFYIPQLLELTAKYTA
ncbi:MAG TPA: response regulator [Puia sp.]|nr:response regulator [Puia sp.]